MPAPITIGRVVIYRSRTGDYEVPAIVTATVDTLNPKGVEAWRASEGAKGVPPLSGDTYVHLTALTPGIPGQRGIADDFKVVSEHPVSENVAGCYQEWDIPVNAPGVVGEPGSCRLPVYYAGP